MSERYVKQISQDGCNLGSVMQIPRVELNLLWGGSLTSQSKEESYLFELVKILETFKLTKWLQPNVKNRSPEPVLTQKEK